MSKDFTTRSINVLMGDLERQGCVIKATKKGYMILFPNGDSTTIHKTPSDVRAIRNVRARIRGAGLEWPMEKGK